MLNRLVGEKDDYRDPESGNTRPKQWRWFHYAEIVAVAFVFISLFVLFGVVSNQKSTNNYYSSSTISSSFSSSSSIKGISAGKAVSFNSAGQIQAGAGTSLYMDIANVVADCPSYPSILAISASNYLLSYANEDTDSATLQLVQVSSTSTGMAGKIISSLESKYYIYAMELLPDSDGAFVAICQDTSTDDETAYVVIGRANPSGPTITIYDSSKVLYAQTYSVNPSIVALSSNSFMIGYYNDPAKLFVAYGRVDFTTSTAPTTTLSPAVKFEDDTTYSFYFTLAPLTSTSAMVLMYNNTTPADINGSGELQAALVTVAGGTANDATAAVVTVGTFYALKSSQVSYYMSATALSDSAVVVAYADASQDYAIVCQVVKLLNQTGVAANEQHIVFGATWTVNSGRAATGNLKTGLMDIDIATISTAGEFMVLFSDLSENGAMTAATGQVSASGEISRTSPDFLLNQGNSQLASVASWGAVTGGILTPLQSQTAILTFLATTDCSAVATSSFNILERLPGAVGIVSANEVTVHGNVAYSANNLVPGKKYYTTTKGNLVADNNYAGRGAGYCPASAYSSSPSGSGCTGYVYDASTKTMISLDSQVGLAVSTNSLSVTAV